MLSVDDTDLEIFSKHVSKIFVKQVLCDLVDTYIPSSNYSGSNPTVAKEDIENTQSCRPTIQRFHAALLFVDISGFTMLSQRLSVEDLRRHINTYFSLILKVVAQYNGDVVKFAGDALFIIWQVEAQDTGSYQSARLSSILSALQCGSDINNLYSNYRIEVNTESEEPGCDDQSIYLSVHSGLSFGLLAGIDVGSGDRWEYLFLGEPIQDVAKAEGDAEKGEIVVSAEVHRVLCLAHMGNSNSSSEYSCSCTATLSGCFKLSSDLLAELETSYKSIDSNLVSPKAFNANTMSRLQHALQVSSQLFEDHQDALMSHIRPISDRSVDTLPLSNLPSPSSSPAATPSSTIRSSYPHPTTEFTDTVNASNVVQGLGRGFSDIFIRPVMSHHPSFYSHLPPISTTVSPQNIIMSSTPASPCVTAASSVSAVSPSQISASVLPSPSNIRCFGQTPRNESSTFVAALKERFLRWSKFCLLDACAAHVHEADRSQFTPHRMLRQNVLHNHVSDIRASRSRVTSATSPTKAASSTQHRSPNHNSTSEQTLAPISNELPSVANHLTTGNVVSRLCDPVVEEGAVNEPLVSNTKDIDGHKHEEEADHNAHQHHSSMLPHWMSSSSSTFVKRLRTAAVGFGSKLGLKNATTQSTSSSLPSLLLSPLKPTAVTNFNCSTTALPPIKSSTSVSAAHSAHTITMTNASAASPTASKSKPDAASYRRRHSRGSKQVGSNDAGNPNILDANAAAKINNNSEDTNKDRSKTVSYRRKMSSSLRQQQVTSLRRQPSSGFNLSSSTSTATSLTTFRQSGNLRRSVREIASSWSLLDESGQHISNSASLYNLNNQFDELSELESNGLDLNQSKKGALDGELRNVTVLFIQIAPHAPTLELSSMSNNAEEEEEVALGPCGFVQRSAAVEASDQLILDHYQLVLSSVLQCLKDKGGQLRQFIVDDKGTVLIGTFGLRHGRVLATDNASAAVECAQTIVEQLQSISKVSIGITTGRAFCGRVGSHQRHEYAVMGPTTNLAARLMSRAASNSYQDDQSSSSILCDLTTRQMNTFHAFEEMGTIVAKGFAQSVLIFRPLFHIPTTVPVPITCSHPSRQSFFKSQNNNQDTVDDVPMIANACTTQMDVAPFPISDAAAVAVASSPKINNRRSAIRRVSLAGAERPRPLSPFKRSSVSTADAAHLDGNSSGTNNRQLVEHGVNRARLLRQSCKTIFGREDELNQVLDIALATDSGYGRKVIFVEAAAGMGKTVFLQTLGRILAASISSSVSKHLVLQVPCVAFHHQHSFFCWQRILRTLLMQLARYSPDYRHLGSHHKNSKHQNRPIRGRRNSQHQAHPPISSTLTGHSQALLLTEIHDEGNTDHHVTNNQLMHHSFYHKSINRRTSISLSTSIAAVVDTHNYHARCRTGSQVYLTSVFSAASSMTAYSDKSSSATAAFSLPNQVSNKKVSMKSKASSRHSNTPQPHKLLQLGLQYYLDSLTDEAASSSFVKLFIAGNILSEEWAYETDVLAKNGYTDKTNIKITEEHGWEEMFLVSVSLLFAFYAKQTKNRPIFLLFDDMHWMDSWSLRLLDTLTTKNTDTTNTVRMRNNIVVISAAILATTHHAESGQESNSKIVFSSTHESPSQPVSTVIESSFEKLRNQNCTCVIPLSPLTEVTICAMFQHHLSLPLSHILLSSCSDNRGNKDNSRQLVERIMSLSGGNALYAFELLQSVKQVLVLAAKPVSVNNLRTSGTEKDDGSSIDEKKVWSEMFKAVSMTTDKLDEVILRRFDCLDAPSQLLLKLLSVAAITTNIGSNMDMMDGSANDNKNDGDPVNRAHFQDQHPRVLRPVSMGLLVHLMCVMNLDLTPQPLITNASLAQPDSYDDKEIIIDDSAEGKEEEAEKEEKSCSPSPEDTLYAHYTSHFRNMEAQVCHILQQLTLSGQFVHLMQHHTDIDHEFEYDIVEDENNSTNSSGDEDNCVATMEEEDVHHPAQLLLLHQLNNRIFNLAHNSNNHGFNDAENNNCDSTNSSHSSNEDGMSVEDDILDDVYVSFRIALEQQVIYKLLLSEQRAHWHGQVQKYLQLQDNLLGNMNDKN